MRCPLSLVTSQTVALTGLMWRTASFAVRSGLRRKCVIPDDDQGLKDNLNLSFDVLLNFWFLLLLWLRNKDAETHFTIRLKEGHGAASSMQSHSHCWGAGV